MSTRVLFGKVALNREFCHTVEEASVYLKAKWEEKGYFDL
jgi:hypothetical protein